MARKPPQVRDKVHVSNLQKETVYVTDSPFGQAEVELLADDGDSVTLQIHAGYLRSGNSRKGKGEDFMGPRNLFVFWDMVKAG